VSFRRVMKITLKCLMSYRDHHSLVIRGQSYQQNDVLSM